MEGFEIFICKENILGLRWARQKKKKKRGGYLSLRYYMCNISDLLYTSFDVIIDLSVFNFI